MGVRLAFFLFRFARSSPASATPSLRHPEPASASSSPAMSDICLATRDARCCFEPMRFSRHAPGEHDVTLDVKYCGVCHSDVHSAKNELMSAIYPMCPGHEIAGVVSAVGAKVTKLKVGDHVGVGCFVDACLECVACKRGDEQFCSAGGMTGTYSSRPAHGRAGSAPTTGGYSTRMVVHEHFALRLPTSIPLPKAGPILCAGVTMYAPLVKWRVGPGSRVGINGLGGLGTMGVKLAKAMGAHVTVLTRSARKEAQARAAGADRVVVSSDPASLKAAASSLDVVLDTVSVRHDLQVSALAPGGLIDLLDANGVWVYTGLILDMQDVQPVRLLLKQISLTGTLIGGIQITQQCIDFCAKHAIFPEVRAPRAAARRALRARPHPSRAAVHRPRRAGRGGRRLPRAGVRHLREARRRQRRRRALRAQHWRNAHRRDLQAEAPERTQAREPLAAGRAGGAAAQPRGARQGRGLRPQPHQPARRRARLRAPRGHRRGRAAARLPPARLGLSAVACRY